MRCKPQVVYGTTKLWVFATNKPHCSMLQRLTLMIAALWWGGITALAFMAVPLLFAQLGNVAVAGSVASVLFVVVAKLSVVAGLGVVWFFMRKVPLPLNGIEFLALVLAILAVVGAMVQDIWVAHQIGTARTTGGNLALWHALGMGLVLMQWAAATCALWALTGLPRQHSAP